MQPSSPRPNLSQIFWNGGSASRESNQDRTAGRFSKTSFLMGWEMSLDNGTWINRKAEYKKYYLYLLKKRNIFLFPCLRILSVAKGKRSAKSRISPSETWPSTKHP